jgi:hypothetical protein
MGRVGFDLTKYLNLAKKRADLCQLLSILLTKKINAR